VDVVLETERLVLRRFTMDDVDALVDLYNDPDVMFFINAGQPVSREEVADDLPAFLEWYERRPEFGFFAAVEKATGRFLGWFQFVPRHHDGVFEVVLGYRLHRFAWGRGYATEGSRALVAQGFAELGIDRVTAETMVVHTASRRVMEKVGMRPLRTFHADWPVRIPGDEHGDVEYAIDRADWEAGHGHQLAAAGKAHGEPERERQRRRVLLVRHAKSSWDDPSLADHDRPLAPRGQRALEKMRGHLEALGIRPDLVLCSSARRTRETLAGIRVAWGDARVDLDAGLYAADTAGLLARLVELGDDVGTVAVIAHNPTLEDLLASLTGADDPLLPDAFPTGAIAVVGFDGHWADLAPGRGSIESAWRPRPPR
jgi:phosphohistidine phosphatase SixA/RimJ/RimL family protein N-acetyltransferase